MKNANEQAILRALGLLAFVSMPALAVQPKSISLPAGVKLTPTLLLSETYDDNIYQANESAVGSTSSWVTTISPNFLLEANQGTNAYQLEYSFDSDFIHNDSDDNNTDHHLRGSAIVGLNRHNRIELRSSYDRVENVFDTEVIGENDKFEQTQVGAVYGFGSGASRFSADVGIHQAWFRSFNSGDAGVFREYDNKGFLATAYYQALPKTRFLLEYDYDDYDYLASSATLDSEREAVYVGATWTATARILGTLKLGWEERDFDHFSRDDNSGFSWQVDLATKLTKRDTFSFNSFQGTTEGGIEEDFVDTTRVGVNWNRRMTPRLSSDFFYTFAESDFQQPSNRTDETNSVGGALQYDVSRRFTVGVEYEHQDRDSSISGRTYNRNLYMLNLNMGL